MKVGIAIVSAIVVLIFGVRYLEGIPLRGTYMLYTEFDRVDGLIPGNNVSVNGVTIGSVTEVRLDHESQRVRVEMRINRGFVVPEGTTAEQTGISAVSAVQVSFRLGPHDNEPIGPGGLVPSASKPDLFTTLVDRVDSTLIGTTATFKEMASMLQEPTSDLRATLASVAQLADMLTYTVQSEHQRITGILQNLEATTRNLDRLSAQGNDSLAVVMGSLNRSMEELRTTLVHVQQLSTDARSVLGKVDAGEGSAGLLVNDPTLYHKLDSTLVNLNQLIEDFRTNPGRYLKELKIIDLL